MHGTHGPISGRNARSLALCAALLAAGVGCAHAPAATRVSLAEVDRGALATYRGEGPLIVEFKPGDRLPVQLGFQSQLFELEQSSAQLTLVAKERCFVRFDENGIRTSRDGVDFEADEPGRFGIHLASERGTPTQLRVQVVAPAHD